MELWEWLRQNLSKISLGKKNRESVPIGPRHLFVREGFHRHDRASEPRLFDSPESGQRVMVQISLDQWQECSAYPGEMSNWLAMEGEVIEVLSSKSVRVTLAPSTDRSPAAFDGCWRAILNFHEGWDYPWLLTSLEFESEYPN